MLYPLFSGWAPIICPGAGLGVETRFTWNAKALLLVHEHE